MQNQDIINAPLSCFAFTSPKVPKVRTFELIAGWDAAFTDAFQGSPLQASPSIKVSFPYIDHNGQGQAYNITDPDGCAWIYGVDTVLPLNTEKGAAVALRLLALMTSLITSPWAGHLIQEDGMGGLMPHPHIIRAAARLELLIGSTFDNTKLHAEITQDSKGLAEAASYL